MSALFVSRGTSSLAGAVLATALIVTPALADHGAPHVLLQQDTKGCTGVLPSNDGNTDMRVVGGTMTPGGTAVFEITYPLNAASVGKEFTILDCAFINDAPALKYIVSFVPSNQSFVLQMTLAVPSDAPVGGTYCNYVKTTGSPTASQASQRKAGPACFVILPPAPPTGTSTAKAPQPTAPRPTVPGPSGGGSTAQAPTTPRVLLPDTAVAEPATRVPCRAVIAARR